MTREEQILNGFTEMMKGLWNNQDLKVPDIETLKSKMTLEKHTAEKQIQDYESKRLIDELSKMPPMVITTAYLHAINYTLYGEDVTEKWVTATQNAAVLEKAYRKGYYDALQKQVKNVTNGDMIQIMFPNIDFTEMAFTVHATTSVTSNGAKYNISYDFWKDWWNAPYKVEKER